MQRTVKDIRVTQAMLRHSNITSTMKYTAACNGDLENAVKAMDWADTAAEVVPAVEPAGVHVAAMSPAQLQDLRSQLAAVLARGGWP